MRKKTRMIVVAIVLVAVVGGISYAMLQLYVDPYLSVDTVVENADYYIGLNIQVKGKVLAGSLTVTQNNITFVIYGETHTLTVMLEGTLPGFEDDQDIVAIGVLQSAKLMIAEEILIQCPSKYETNSTTSV